MQLTPEGSMLTTLLTLVALAAPPSSDLTGPTGNLTWTTADSGDRITIEGVSPKWSVEHVADKSLNPIRTVHHNGDGTTVTIEYNASGATLVVDGERREVRGAGLWDGDVLDVRLGAEVASGRTNIVFTGLDPSSGKVYSFDTAKVADEMCGASRCTHVRVQLAGWLRHLGPTWHYWYASDGELLRFEGPAGK
ncbi:MAG: hypothetical protein ACI9MC_001558, partial [Kiritimatiellia bacterium]